MTDTGESIGGRAQRAAEKYIRTLHTERPGLAVRDFRAGYEQAVREEASRLRSALRERDEAREALRRIEKQFPHSSSCNLSDFVMKPKDGCNCGTWSGRTVSVVKKALSEIDGGEG